jgi:hypothetical protein
MKGGKRLGHERPPMGEHRQWQAKEAGCGQGIQIPTSAAGIAAKTPIKTPSCLRSAIATCGHSNQVLQSRP